MKVKQPYSKYAIIGKNDVRASELNLETLKHFKYKREHPNNNPSKALIDGTAFHTFMSDPESMEDEFAFLYDNMRPNLDGGWMKTENRRFREHFFDEAIKHGKQPYIVNKDIEDQIQVLKDMRDNMLDQKIVSFKDGEVVGQLWMRDLLEEGLSEMSCKTVDLETNLNIKYRPDWFTKTRGGVIIDFKTARSVKPKKFMDFAIKNGYIIKETVYKDYLSIEEDMDFQKVGYLAIEKEPPYMAGLFFISEDVQQYARMKYRENLNKIAEAFHTDVWPGYEGDTINGFHMIELPSYLQNEL